MSVVPSSVRVQVWVLALLALVCSLACSSDGSDGAPTVEGSEDARDSEAAGDTGGDGMLPLGAAWGADTVAEFDGFGVVHGVTTAAGSGWIFGTRWNAPVLWRGDGDGTWEEIEVAPPDARRIDLRGVLERPEGGFLAFGDAETDCLEYDAPAPYRFLDMCRRSQPILYLSDDGQDWRTVEPPAMLASGDHSVVLAGVSLHQGGFVAVGTVKGPEWHGRVWTSADGEAWTLAAELPADELLTVQQVLSDGEQLVVAEAHECGEVEDISQGGWVPGSVGWSRHLRIYQGADPAALLQLQPGEHPLAAAPMDADCSATSGVQLDSVPYAWAEGILAGGTITLVERAAETDTDDDEERVRRIVSLVDGAWVTEETSALPVDADGYLIDVDGTVGFVGAPSAGAGLRGMWTVLPDGEASWGFQEAGNAVLGSFDSGAVYLDSSLVLAGTLRSNPFLPRYVAGSPQTVMAWRSRAVATEEWHACALVPESACSYVTFEHVEGYPDFAGVDLSGADLTAANLDGANFEGASFRGATLTGASASGASFLGADFTRADLSGSELRGMGGTDLTDAVLVGARIRFADAPILTGASLANAWLWQESVGGDYADVELSLAGLDLTDMRVTGPSEDERRIVVTDLRGAVVANTTFSAVDLSSADVTGVDLSGLRIDEESLCPSGKPPVVESSFGTCE